MSGTFDFVYHLTLQAPLTFQNSYWPTTHVIQSKYKRLLYPPHRQLSHRSPRTHWQSRVWLFHHPTLCFETHFFSFFVLVRGRESLSRTRLKIWVLFLHHFRSVPVEKNNNHGVSVLVTLPMTSLHWRILLCLTFFFFLEEDQSHLLCVFSYRPKPQHLMWQETQHRKHRKHREKQSEWKTACLQASRFCVFVKTTNQCLLPSLPLTLFRVVYR